MERLENWMLASAVFLAPWASVDLLRAAGLPALGAGIQPAYVPLLVLILLLVWRSANGSRPDGAESAIATAVLWTAAASALSWSIADMGLAGERPWSKSLKQLVQWAFFATAAVAVARVVARERAVVVERALCSGLLLACLLAIGRAFAGSDQVGLGVLDTNPSIASGSDELYLGHSFTGIARLRGAMPEPLMFGSYLLAAVPLVGLSAFARSGAPRWWRLALALVGLVCLFGTWSRGAWLGGVVTAVAVSVLWWRGRLGTRSGRLAVAGGGSMILIGMVLASAVLQVDPWEVPGLLADRIGQSLAGHDMSNMTRLWAWNAAWNMFLDAPVAGHGWGSFGFLFFRYAADGASGAHFGWPVPNNLGLLLMAETGLIGLGLWCWSLMPALSGLGQWRQGALGAVMACSVLGALAQLSTFSQWNLPHLWLLYGAALGVARIGAVPAPGD